MAKRPTLVANPVADATTSTAQEPVVTLPAKIKMIEPYGFYDDAGVLQFWQQAEVIENPDTIALLDERGAVFVAC